MQNQARLSRYEPPERVSSGLRELQSSSPVFQQTPSFQALDRNPIHLSLEKLGFSDVLQRQLFRRAKAWLGYVWVVHCWPISLQDWCRSAQSTVAGTKRRAERPSDAGAAPVRLPGSLSRALRQCPSDSKASGRGWASRRRSRRCSTREGSPDAARLGAPVQ